MWLLASLALGTPDPTDVGFWSDRLDNARRGPDGCWDIEGHVTWELIHGKDRNIGSSPFTVRLDAHRFGPFVLDHPERTYIVDGEVRPADLAQQFRPVLGDSNGSFVAHGRDGVFLRDARSRELPSFDKTRDGTVWVEPSASGLEVHFERDVVRSGSVEARDAFVGAVRPGEDFVQEVRYESPPKRFAWGARREEGTSTLSYRAPGVPSFEEASIRFSHRLGADSTYHHTLRYDRLTPCAPLPQGPLPTVPGQVTVRPSSAGSPLASKLVEPDPDGPPDLDLLRASIEADRQYVRRQHVSLGTHLAIAGGTIGVGYAIGLDEEPLFPWVVGATIATTAVLTPLRLAMAHRVSKRAKARQAALDLWTETTPDG